MKKKADKQYLFLYALAIFALAFTIILITIPDEFENYADMGTSATGMALSRSYFDHTLDQYTHSSGYFINGHYHEYTNWPSFGFKVLAQWYRALGEDSIYNARLFSSLLYALSALLFFLLLIRSGFELEIGILSVVLFAVLPFNLEYGKLIFSDMWLLPFWLLCSLIFTFSKRFQWLLVPVALLGTVSFMWFVVFVIPGYILTRLFDRFRIKAHQFVLALLVLLGITLIFQWITFSFFQE